MVLLFLCLCLCLCICLSVCLSVCLCACACVCVCARACVWVCTLTFLSLTFASRRAQLYIDKTKAVMDGIRRSGRAAAQLDIEGMMKAAAGK